MMRAKIIGRTFMRKAIVASIAVSAASALKDHQVAQAGAAAVK
jgi:hypothetical protein